MALRIGLIPILFLVLGLVYGTSENFEKEFGDGYVVSTVSDEDTETIEVTAEPEDEPVTTSLPLSWLADYYTNAKGERKPRPVNNYPEDISCPEYLIAVFEDLARESEKINLWYFELRSSLKSSEEGLSDWLDDLRYICRKHKKGTRFSRPKKSVPPAENPEIGQDSVERYYWDKLATKFKIDHPGWVPEDSVIEDRFGEVVEQEKHCEKEDQEFSSIRGVPHINFPGYSDIPQTSFSCADKKSEGGFYADIETGCQAFHVCWPHRRESFLCPNGTTFNQAILACDFWYSSNCAHAPSFFDVPHFKPEVSTSQDDTQESVPVGEKTGFSKEVDVETAAFTVNEWARIVKFLPVKVKVTEYPEPQITLTSTKKPGSTTPCPTTAHSSTARPTTAHPTTAHPTTAHPTYPTARPTTAHPTTTYPTAHPTTAHPTTAHPTYPTARPTTAHPTTAYPTARPTTARPTYPTAHPTTAHPTTVHPTTAKPKVLEKHKISLEDLQISKLVKDLLAIVSKDADKLIAKIVSEKAKKEVVKQKLLPAKKIVPRKFKPLVPLDPKFIVKPIPVHPKKPKIVLKPKIIPEIVTKPVHPKRPKIVLKPKVIPKIVTKPVLKAKKLLPQKTAKPLTLFKAAKLARDPKMDVVLSKTMKIANKVLGTKILPLTRHTIFENFSKVSKIKRH